MSELSNKLPRSGRLRVNEKQLSVGTMTGTYGVQPYSLSCTPSAVQMLGSPQAWPNWPDRDSQEAG